MIMEEDKGFLAYGPNLQKGLMVLCMQLNISEIQNKTVFTLVVLFSCIVCAQSVLK